MENILCRKILKLISEETGISLKDLLKTEESQEQKQKLSAETSPLRKPLSIETPTATQVSPSKSLLDNILSSFDLSVSKGEEKRSPSQKGSKSPPAAIFEIVGTPKSPQRFSLSSSQTQIMTQPSPKQPIPKFWVPGTPSSTQSTPEPKLKITPPRSSPPRSSRSRSSPSRLSGSMTVPDTHLFPELSSLMYKASPLSEREEEKEKKQSQVKTPSPKTRTPSPKTRTPSPKTRTPSPESISGSQRSMPSFFGKKEEKKKGEPAPTWLRRKIKGSKETKRQPISKKSPKEKGTTYDKEKCKKFLQADQLVQEGSNVKNPFTNKPITKGKATYKKILKECKENTESSNPIPQSKKPKTKKSFILPGESFEDLDVKSLLKED
jgi:hypothetical protein